MSGISLKNRDWYAIAGWVLFIGLYVYSSVSGGDVRYVFILGFTYYVLYTFYKSVQGGHAEWDSRWTGVGVIALVYLWITASHILDKKEFVSEIEYLCYKQKEHLVERNAAFCSELQSVVDEYLPQ